LFEYGDFTLASGRTSHFKIECDHLSDSDWWALAQIIIRKGVEFRDVVGVPRGGLKLAHYLRRFALLGDHTLPLLIVDDVFTTGKSMEREKEKYSLEFPNIVGIVVFARGECPGWIKPIFRTDWLS
jgi:orotate phosphoribosyltransferase